MVKHTQTIRRQFNDELFECVCPLYGVGVWRDQIICLPKLQEKWRNQKNIIDVSLIANDFKIVPNLLNIKRSWNDLITQWYYLNCVWHHLKCVYY